MNKYHAQKTEVDGIWFASKKEANRYIELRLLERAGEISDLKLQPRFPIVMNGIKVCTYIADFQYIDKGKVVTEDVKGVKTPTYKIKKKLVKAVYNIDILET